MLIAERAEIEQFVTALFRYADDSSFISLRAFDQADRGNAPLLVQGVRVDSDVVGAAAHAAQRAANSARPCVFAPPVATFRDGRTAKTVDLANGVAISVELDQGDTRAAQLRLEFLLGPVTVAVASGGQWVDQSTGEVHDKRHLHWRLSEPTRTPDEHEQLRTARYLAALLNDGDPTAAPPAHPLRWPGSWNLKGSPRLAMICGGNPAAEVHLQGALDKLQEAVERAGIASQPAGPKASGQAQADMARVADAVQHIRNADVHWDQWNRVGMALYRASGGGGAGLDVWEAWSEKSTKSAAGACAERWAHFGTSPPTTIGAGTLFFMAKAEGWGAQPEAPAAVDDAGYWASIEADDLSAIEGEWHDEADAPASEQPPPPDAENDIRTLLSIEAWADREMPEPDYLLGNLITTTSRAFLVGRTGLGKTMLALAIAVGVASGRGFLQWRSSRPARVLYIDGEMPAELIKARAVDALRRASVQIPPGNLVIFGRDIEEEVARQLPMLGTLAPLNTEAGQNFVHALIAALGGVDLVIFDNVMSLVAGDQKDEIPWSETMPLVQALTSRRIGQLWLDHTGHNSDRQYGSSTKSWRFDAVGNMAPLPEGERDPRSVGFTLSFDHPGKARRRTPENWREFAPCTIRLADDVWAVETAEKERRPRAKLSPLAQQFYSAVLDALAISPTPGQTTRPAWYAECVRVGLAEALSPDEGWKTTSDKQAKFRRYLCDLKVEGLIGVDGPTIFDLRQRAKTPC